MFWFCSMVGSIRIFSVRIWVRRLLSLEFVEIWMS